MLLKRFLTFGIFFQSERVTFDEFREWVVQRREVTSLTRWLLFEKSTVTLSNELETPTFYQTLAGVTHCKFFSFLLTFK